MNYRQYTVESGVKQHQCGSHLTLYNWNSVESGVKQHQCGSHLTLYEVNCRQYTGFNIVWIGKLVYFFCLKYTCTFSK